MLDYKATVFSRREVAGSVAGLQVLTLSFDLLGRCVCITVAAARISILLLGQLLLSLPRRTHPADLLFLSTWPSQTSLGVMRDPRSHF